MMIEMALKNSKGSGETDMLEQCFATPHPYLLSICSMISAMQSCAEMDFAL